MSDTVQALQRALDHIEAQLFEEELAISGVAEAAYMSVPNLYRVFYALTGHPLKEYIRKRRISEAAVLLRETGRPVVDIAFACGFDAYRTFAGAFKKLTGLTPGVYRSSDVYYSFEPVNLLESVDYSENRELSGRHPDVKVVRLQPQRMVARRHVETAREGLEAAAYRTFGRLLAGIGADSAALRMFGYNFEPDEAGAHGYVTMTPLEGLPDAGTALPGCETIDFDGGLFAAARAPVGSGAVIVRTWNRLLAEWLPRSAFTLGDMPFVEEVKLAAEPENAIARMKLYLPVIRKQEQETIEVVVLEDMRAAAFRAYGEDAFEQADGMLTDWLRQAGLAGTGRLELAMRCSYGAADDETGWCELAALLPGDMPDPTGAEPVTFRGGRYACMTTGAYGAMTGVLDQVYRWIAGTGRYRVDEERSWFAKYIPGDPSNLERTTLAVCCVPVVNGVARG